MTLINARVLYKHRLELGKKVDDLLERYPELSKTEKVVEDKEEDKVVKKGIEQPEIIEKPKKPNKPKGKRKNGKI